MSDGLLACDEADAAKGSYSGCGKGLCL